MSKKKIIKITAILITSTIAYGPLFVAVYIWTAKAIALAVLWSVVFCLVATNIANVVLWEG